MPLSNVFQDIIGRNKIGGIINFSFLSVPYCTEYWNAVLVRSIALKSFVPWFLRSSIKSISILFDLIQINENWIPNKLPKQLIFVPKIKIWNLRSVRTSLCPKVSSRKYRSVKYFMDCTLLSTKIYIVCTKRECG